GGLRVVGATTRSRDKRHVCRRFLYDLCAAEWVRAASLCEASFEQGKGSPYTHRFRGNAGRVGCHLCDLSSASAHLTICAGLDSTGDLRSCMGSVGHHPAILGGRKGTRSRSRIHQGAASQNESTFLLQHVEYDLSADT